MKDEILTSEGWVPYHGHLGDAICCDCPAQATKVVDAGGILWAQCADCAHESRCSSMEAAHRSDYEMDHYAGYE